MNEPTNKHSQAHRIWRRKQTEGGRIASPEEEMAMDHLKDGAAVAEDEAIPTEEPTDPDDVAVEPGEFGDGEVI